MTSVVLQRLLKGPLRAEDYAEIAASKNSLKVGIHRLREQGYAIRSVEIPNGNRRPKIEYRLDADVCPCCGHRTPSSS